MSTSLRAIYENGVFRPLEATVPLPDHSLVRIVVESVDGTDARVNDGDPLQDIRAATGFSDLAERFDEYRFRGPVE